MSTELTKKERAARARYFREWRAKNKHKVSEYNKRYWQRKAAQEQVNSESDTISSLTQEGN